MAIDFDRFLNWAERRFSDVVVKGEEIKVNSIFCEDYKHHLWCNPSGGKKDRPNGVFRCWKTDTKGSLVTLVMLVDHCTFEEAMEILGGADTNLQALEKMVEEMLFSKTPPEKPLLMEETKLTLPPFTYTFDDLPSYSYFRVHGEAYLLQRRLPTTGLMICCGGDYKNRVIIPYYNKDKQLIYYNGRYIGDNEKVLRYLGPPKEIGIGKGDVLFVPIWPEPGDFVYLTEGEFDALSLCACGYKGIAFGGKSLSETQIILLRDMGIVPVLALDADKYGKLALAKMGQQLLAAGFKKIAYVRPKEEDKDWNKFLQRLGPRVMKQYIKNSTKVYDEWTDTFIKTLA